MKFGDVTVLLFWKELFDSTAPQNAENRTVANSLLLFLKYSVKCLFLKRLYQTVENLKYHRFWHDCFYFLVTSSSVDICNFFIPQVNLHWIQGCRYLLVLLYNTRTSFVAYRVFLGIKHVSLSNQRRFKDVQGCLWFGSERLLLSVCWRYFSVILRFITWIVLEAFLEWGRVFMNEGNVAFMSNM